VGGYTQKGANSMAVSGLGFREALVGTGHGWAVSLLLSMIGLRKPSSNSPCRVSISSIKVW